MKKPVIIVPCFNHADAFVSVADKLSQFKHDVIVVDDGSHPAQSKKIKNICKKHKFKKLSKFEKQKTKAKYFGDIFVVA